MDAPRSISLIDSDMRAQLDEMFGRMEHAVVLDLVLDDSAKSEELNAFMDELASLTDKILVRHTSSCQQDSAPCVRLLREDGSWTGLAFHGVPGGHEFTSFVLGIYNVSGSGQKIDAADEARARAIEKETKIQIAVTLSCTMCPTTVTAAQKIASLNERVTAEIYDISLFPQMRREHKIMSVPAILVNGTMAGFGSKDLSEMLDLLGA